MCIDDSMDIVGLECAQRPDPQNPASDSYHHCDDCKHKTSAALARCQSLVVQRKFSKASSGLEILHREGEEAGDGNSFDAPFPFPRFFCCFFFDALTIWDLLGQLPSGKLT